MARNAVILSVILSLFLLCHARVDPSTAAVSQWNPQESKPEVEVGPLAVIQRDPQEKSRKETVSVDLRPIHLTTVANDADRSRMIAHSLRLPIGRHVSKPIPHHASLRPTVELPYGNDMVGLPKMEKKKKKKKKDCHDVDSDSDDDEDEMEHRKKKMMKKRLKMMMKMKKLKRDHHGGFMEWISGFLNRF